MLDHGHNHVSKTWIYHPIKVQFVTNPYKDHAQFVMHIDSRQLKKQIISVVIFAKKNFQLISICFRYWVILIYAPNVRRLNSFSMCNNIFQLLNSILLFLFVSHSSNFVFQPISISTFYVLSLFYFYSDNFNKCRLHLYFICLCHCRDVYWTWANIIIITTAYIQIFPNYHYQMRMNKFFLKKSVFTLQFRKTNANEQKKTVKKKEKRQRSQRVHWKLYFQCNEKWIFFLFFFLRFMS